MEPWHKVAEPRKEVREGRSFNPNEFAIALEQVVEGNAPQDYRNPEQFFARTCFTRALTDHMGQVLRRLAGETSSTAPVLALITQFGGGKTHTLTALYHLIKSPAISARNADVKALLQSLSLKDSIDAKVGVFVGNAWDPSDGRETPWIDLAHQVAGDRGVAALGPEARQKAPGTANLAKVFEAAGGHVLILCDEVLNFLSRHQDRAQGFRDFLGNLVRALTGTTGCAAVISLPQSRPEMSDFDLRWQEIITKEVGRVAKQLIANDESEIGEVVRRRLFENLGNERVRKNIAKKYAAWCFERRERLPIEWTAVDSAATEAKAKEVLQGRFEACYPFHPATLSVFQRKWQALAQYQQTRGTLAMLAQWVSLAYQGAYANARREPLITLGTAPLEVPEFRGIVLSQLGEPRLLGAIEADLSGPNAHARALDVDRSGDLQAIHQRVGAAIFFESSGGQSEKMAHLPELRFAIGGPDVDTTTVDTTAGTLEDKAYFIRRAGTDGFKFGYQATLKKVVHDRRASLDEDDEVKPAMRKLIEQEFKKSGGIPVQFFPEDGAAIPDNPRLTLWVLQPDQAWDESSAMRQKLADWMKKRGRADRLYPGALVFCCIKPGKELQEKVELSLAWRRVQQEIQDGTLGGEYSRTEKAEIQAKAGDSEEAAKDEVWGDYRYAAIFDPGEADGLKILDLGAGHSSGSETLAGRVITALRSRGLLEEGVGAGYLDRHWPPALVPVGEWPLLGLRQSFLNGSLIRLLDPDTVLKKKILEFVGNGEYGLASGKQSDGSYSRVWFAELVAVDDVAFEADVFLLKKEVAKQLKQGSIIVLQPSPSSSAPQPQPVPPPKPVAGPVPLTRQLRITGQIPPEAWNRIGTRLIPKLRQGSSELNLNVDLTVTLDTDAALHLEAELKQILEDLGVQGTLKIE